MLRAEDICERCDRQRWICEAHPDRPLGHENCAGRGQPCPRCNVEDPLIGLKALLSLLVAVPVAHGVSWIVFLFLALLPALLAGFGVNSRMLTTITGWFFMAFWLVSTVCLARYFFSRISN